MSIQTAITLAYLLCVAASLAVLLVALRRRQNPPPTSGPARLDPAHKAEIRAILTAAAQLAARVSTAP